MHTLLWTELEPDVELAEITGEEARHAVRVKRLKVGETLRLLNGRGGTALAEVIATGPALKVRILERRHEPQVSPRVDVWSATPKGPRAADLIDHLVQVGAASWTPMSTALGVVDPRDSKLERLDRVALEACKQATRPWLFPIEPKRSFSEALVDAPGTLVIADATGSAYQPGPTANVRLLIGPEGGFTRRELDDARSAGADVISLGPHTLRIELAAPVATAIILDAHRRSTHPR